MPSLRFFVKVRLKEYGSELVEVADNGGGVDPANYQSLTLKYHTSKLQQFSDLQVSSHSLPMTNLCSVATDAKPMSAFAEPTFKLLCTTLRILRDFLYLL